LLAGGLFVGMLILLKVGQHVGVRQLTRDPLDLEYPRLGSIRIDAFDQALRDLRESMK
jgi:hypothetical protein